MAKKTLNRINEFLKEKGFKISIEKKEINATKDGFEVIVAFNPKEGNKIVELYLNYESKQVEVLTYVDLADKVFYAWVVDKETDRYYQISAPYRSQRIYALDLIEHFVKDPVETTITNMYSYLPLFDELLKKIERFGYLKDY